MMGASANAENWHFDLFGPLCARRGERIVTRFTTQKTASLLGLLAVAPTRMYRRAELMDHLWPGTSEGEGRNRLSLTLTYLRKHLEDDQISTPDLRLLQADRQHVQLAPDQYTTDKGTFETLLRQAGRATEIGARARLLEQAVALYKADLLPTCDAIWFSAERQRLLDAYVLALRRLVKALVEMRQMEQALVYARRAVEADPLREETHRDLIRLYAGLGQPGRALQQYQRLETLLRDELALSPAPQTMQLREMFAPSSAPPPVSPQSVPQMEETAPNDVPLPRPLTRLFGTDERLEPLLHLLTEADIRLVTLTGLGGMGKTRLALAAAQRLREQGKRVTYLSLAAVEDAAQLWGVMAHALPGPDPNAPPEDQVRAALQSGPHWLVLDNFEQLCLQASGVVYTLLRTAPAVCCLITSRQRLNLMGEYEVNLSPLPVPPLTADAAALRRYASVELFVDRARTVRPDFDLDATQAPVVAALCRHLDGIPLALELAAGWAGSLTPAQILRRLQRPDQEIVSRYSDIPERHRSLHTVLRHSYEALPVDLQRFFAQLAVFRGGWTLEAAESVCENVEAMELLTQLQDRSLITAVPDGSEMRYGWLETLRDFAARQRSAAETEALSRRHIAFFLGMVQSLKMPLQQGTSSALQCLDREQANLHTALETGLTQQPDGLRLASALHHYWYLRGRLAEGAAWLSRHLKACPSENLSTEACLDRAEALGRAGNFAYLRADYDAALGHYQACAALAEEAQNPGLQAFSLGALGKVAIENADLKRANAALQQALTLYRQIDDTHGEALVLGSLAHLAETQEDWRGAEAAYAASVRLLRQAGRAPSLGLVLLQLCACRIELGAYEEAAAALAEGLATLAQSGSPAHRTLGLLCGAGLAVAWNQNEDACTWLRQAEMLREQYALVWTPQTQAREQRYRCHVLQALGATALSRPEVPESERASHDPAQDVSDALLIAWLKRQPTP